MAHGVVIRRLRQPKSGTTGMSTYVVKLTKAMGTGLSQVQFKRGALAPVRVYASRVKGTRVRRRAPARAGAKETKISVISRRYPVYSQAYRVYRGMHACIRVYMCVCRYVCRYMSMYMSGLRVRVDRWYYDGHSTSQVVLRLAL